MTAPKTAVVVSEERPAIAYPLRSPVLEVMRSDEAKAAIVPLLPRGADYEQVMIEVHRAATVNADIMKCTPPSIIMAVGMAVQTGLTIGKTIHLVPVKKKIGENHYEDRLDAWTDYKGDIELVIRSGAARHVDAQVVYANDTFDFQLGDSPYVKHRPVLTNRGRIIGAYAIAYLTATLKKVVVLSIDDIEKVRKGSKQWNPTKYKECPDWYAMKTAIHRVTKTLPRNPALAAVLALLDRQAEHDRSDDLGLDPAMEIPAPDPVATSTSGFSTSNEVADAETTAEDVKWETAAEAPARSKAWLFAMPFGNEGKGKPIGEFSPEDLESARSFARRKGGFQEFLDASDELLEERRLAAQEAHS